MKPWYANAFFATLITVAATRAATIPYTENFDAQTSAPPITNTGEAWTQGSGGTWSLTSGSDKKYNWASSVDGPGSSSFSASNSPTSGSFTLTETFTLNTNTATASGAGFASNTVGFGLFGLNNTFTGSSTANAYYLADIATAGPTSTGTIRILALGDTSGATNATSTATGTFATGTVYTLTLNGSFTGGTLTMNLSISGGGVSGSSGNFTDTSPLTGTNFGLRDRVNISPSTGSASASLSVDQDNVAISAPEPATIGLLLCGAALLGARRPPRRR